MSIRRYTNHFEYASVVTDDSLPLIRNKKGECETFLRSFPETINFRPEFPLDFFLVHPSLYPPPALKAAFFDLFFCSLIQVK